MLRKIYFSLHFFSNFLISFLFDVNFFTPQRFIWIAWKPKNEKKLLFPSDFKSKNCKKAADDARYFMLRCELFYARNAFGQFSFLSFTLSIIEVFTSWNVKNSNKQKKKNKNENKRKMLYALWHAAHFFGYIVDILMQFYL